MQYAFHVAASGRPGPVVVSLPEDVDRDGRDSPPWPVAKTFAAAPSADGIAAALALIGDAQRPCIVAGGGVLRAGASDKLVRFAEMLAVPVYTAWRRFDAFPNDHPLYLGGMPLLPADLMEPLMEADLVLALGTRLGEFTTKSYTWPRPGQKLLHVGLAAEDSGGGWAGADVALAADTGETLTALMNGLGDGRPSAAANERRRTVARWREHFVSLTTPRADRDGGDDAVDPEGIFFDLNRRLGVDASITCDAGNFGGWLMRYYRWIRPRTFFGPTAGGMGYAVPAAIGAKLARPGAPALAFCGDGGFAMTMSEVETAVRLGLSGWVALVFNNNSYGTIRGHQQRTFPGRIVATDLGAIDFAGVGEAMGAAGFRVRRNSEFAVAFDRALNAGRPAVIDIAINCDRLDAWEETPSR